MGIALWNDGPSLNDSGDADLGPNHLQNHPVLELIDPGPPYTLVDVTFNSSPFTPYHFDFFENEESDTSGYGEGEIFVAWADSTTDGSGNVSFTVFFDPPVAHGHCITATATNLVTGSTSEFSPVIFIGEILTLSGFINAGDLQLEWTGLPGADRYRLYGMVNDQYFVPSPSNMMVEVLPWVTTWGGLPEAGNSNSNWTYIVIAIGDYNQEMARSNRFGEWDFDL